MKESESAHLTRAERIAILAAVIRGVVAGVNIQVPELPLCSIV